MRASTNACGLFGCGDRRDLEAELGPVTVGGRDQGPGRTQVGTAGRLPRRLFRPHPSRECLVGEHVQLQRHAEDDRLLELVGCERMGMAIDQAGNQRLALPLDDLRICGNRNFRLGPSDAVVPDDDRGRAAVAYHDRRRRDDLGPIEDSHVAEHQDLLGREGRTAGSQEEADRRGQGGTQETEVPAGSKVTHDVRLIEFACAPTTIRQDPVGRSTSRSSQRGESSSRTFPMDSRPPAWGLEVAARPLYG